MTDPKFSTIDLFAPGRLCLFGEHTDWAGGYRNMDPSISPGYCLTAGTDQGIRGQARIADGKLRINSVLPDGSLAPPLDMAMDRDLLFKEARSGGFWSYAAGVAHEASIMYGIGGLEVRLYGMDLPIKKGLSSSAAFCVLLANAWNRLYGLDLNAEQIMDLAYRGETLTPSECGRMDQICAFGQNVCFLIFDGDNMQIELLKPGITLYLLIVDLCGSKDTVRILRDLNGHYPAASGALSRKVRDALGPMNEEILTRARRALIEGNAPLIGDLMIQAQATFDAYVAPASPEDLSAPRLHGLLSHKPLQDLIYGGKGVGSQGDGTAQLLAKGPKARNEVRKIVEQDLNMTCHDLTLTCDAHR